jgi:hypothetical protein
MKAFTDKQKEFLKNYKPASDLFTSWDEVKKIGEVLELDGMPLEDMRECRNQVVKLYSNMFEDGHEDNYTLMTSMMSVTAAIDHLSNGYTA